MPQNHYKMLGIKPSANFFTSSSEQDVTEIELVGRGKRLVPGRWTILDVLLVGLIMIILYAVSIPMNPVPFEKRKKVSEAIQLLAGLRTPAEEYMAANNGEFPPKVEALTRKTSGKYTASLTSDPDNLYFEATMSEKDDALGNLVVLKYR